MTLAAYSVKQNETIDGSDTFTWASDNTGVATVSAGVVTAVASGTCNITATSVNGNGEGFFPLGVALLTLGSSSIAFGQSTTISCNGGSGTTKWTTGTPGVIALVGTPDPSTGFVAGASITVDTISGAFTQSSSNPPATATAHCPIFCIVLATVSPDSVIQQLSQPLLGTVIAKLQAAPNSPLCEPFAQVLIRGL